MVRRASVSAVACSPACACRAPQQACARGHDLETVARQDARGRPVVRAEDGLLDAPGEEPHPPASRALGRGHLGQRRPVRRGRQLGQQRLPVPERCGQECEQPGSAHQAAQAARLIEAQPPRGQPQEARAREQQREVHPAEEPAQRAARPLALDLRARRLDELAVGHARGTHGLAGAAAEAEIQVRGGGVGQGDASLGQRLDQENAPARRVHLGAQLGERRAVGEAEPAVHAAVDTLDALPVQGERGVRRLGGRRSVRHRLRCLRRSGPGSGCRSDRVAP